MRAAFDGGGGAVSPVPEEEPEQEERQTTTKTADSGGSSGSGSGSSSRAADTPVDSPDYEQPPAVQDDDGTDGFDLRYVRAVGPNAKGKAIRVPEGTTEAEAAQIAKERGVIEDDVVGVGTGDYYHGETGENLTTEAVDTMRAVGGHARSSDVDLESPKAGTVLATNEKGEKAVGTETRKKIETDTGTHYTTTTTTVSDDGEVSTGQQGDETVGYGPDAPRNAEEEQQQTTTNTADSGGSGGSSGSGNSGSGGQGGGSPSSGSESSGPDGAEGELQITGRTVGLAVAGVTIVAVTLGGGR